MDSNITKAEELKQENLENNIKIDDGSYIIKIPHTKNFTTISNSTLYDNRLSAKATGFLVIMLSYPDDWRIRLTHLATVKTDGITAVRSALKELEKYGYIHSFQPRDEKGRLLPRIYMVSEVPKTKEEVEEFKKSLPQCGFLQAVGPLSEKGTLLNTNILNTNINNTKGEPPKKIQYSENVEMTERDYNKLIEKFGKEKVILAVEKYDRWKYNRGVGKINDYKEVKKWVEGDALQEEREKEALGKIKSKNIEFLNSHIKYLERANAKGDLKYDEQEVYDSVLGFSTSVSGPKMIDNVKKWDQFRKIIK